MSNDLGLNRSYFTHLFIQLILTEGILCDSLCSKPSNETKSFWTLWMRQKKKISKYVNNVYVSVGVK